MNDEPKETGQFDSDREKYQQLGLFSLIVAEMTLVPGGLAGLAYYLTRDREVLGLSWKVWTGVAAFIGFGIAFYRIFLLTKQQNRKNG